MRRTAVLTAVVAAALAGSVVPAYAGGPPRHPGPVALGHGATYRWHPGHGGVGLVTVAPGEVGQLRVVLAHDRVGGALETVSSMCRRYHCLAAVNGDFFGSGDRLGGIVVDRRVVRSNSAGHEQLLVHPAGAVPGGSVSWGARLATSTGQQLGVEVNVTHRPAALTLLTPTYGGRPSPSVGRVALMLKAVEPRSMLDRLGSSVPMTVVAFRPTQAVRYVPRGWAVVLGRGVGAKQLHDLYQAIQRGQVSRRVTVDWGAGGSIRASVGGHPIVIQGGRVRVDRSDPLVVTRHVRTLVAGGPDGRIWLMTTDRPMSLAEAAGILQKWHAQWAVNLDGGGSTTMVVRGRVVNRLQDGRERPVASAVLLVPGRPPAAHSSVRATRPAVHPATAKSPVHRRGPVRWM